MDSPVFAKSLIALLRICERIFSRHPDPVGAPRADSDHTKGRRLVYFMSPSHLI